MRIFLKFRKYLYSRQIVMRLAISCIKHKNLLPTILCEMKSNQLRKIFFLPEHTIQTQLNQDFFALICNKFMKGYFIEIGANDGFELSNTVYLEECFGWEGILVEPNPIYSENLGKRSSKIVQKAISSTPGLAIFKDAGLFGGISRTIDTAHSAITSVAKEIEVDTTSLEEMLVLNRAPKIIDFVSIDIEGGEVDVVQQLCGTTSYRFKSGCIEHNNREEDYKVICEMLDESGYRVAWKGMTGHDIFFVDQNLVDSNAFSIN